MIFHSLPIWSIDLVGSILMIIFSFICLRLVHTLRRRDPNNVIWTYLLLVCFGLACFAVSRSAGHILKQILVITGQSTLWGKIRPFSGAINTLTFVFVGAVTLFFERIWIIYRQIFKDKQTLQSTRDELLYLNQNLGNLVAERTQELAQSEHKYRRIYEVSRDMIVVTTRQGEILNLNPAGYEMLGYRADDFSFVGQSFESILMKAADWRMIKDAIDRQGFIANTEVDLQHKENRTIRSLISGSLDKGLSDKEDTIHFLVKDIEQRRQIEEQIAQADKLASIGQLSAGIAHEINNPLGIILGYTQLLIRNEDGQTDKYKDLKTIEKHVRNCKTIVEDLLNFSRTSTPKEDLIRIDDAIEDVLKFMQHHADLDRVEIHKNYDASIPEMLLDEKKIKQVLINLIMNAKHAIGRSGVLSLSTQLRPTARQVIIKIADNGHGIERKNLSRIFDPFFTTKPTGEGTGLGLSVSYGIIKNHGGDILVDSKVGQGSTFTVILPIVSPVKDKANAKIHSYRR
jgi:PAS domain S-box-containing protein